jgi:hypothetical protein
MPLSATLEALQLTWKAQGGMDDGTRKNLGRYDTAEEAAQAYNDAVARFGLIGRKVNKLP